MCKTCLAEPQALADAGGERSDRAHVEELGRAHLRADRNACPRRRRHQGFRRAEDLSFALA